MTTQRPAPASGLDGAYATVARAADPVGPADEKPASGGREGPPRNLLDLLDRWFSEPSWSRTVQIVLVLAVVLVGLAFVALAAADGSPLWWSAVGVAAASGAGLVQRRRREQRTQESQGDESPR